MDMSVARAKQALPSGGDVDATVAQFPVAGWGGRNCAPEQTCEQLVAETYACEVEIRFGQPQIYSSLAVDSIFLAWAHTF